MQDALNQCSSQRSQHAYSSQPAMNHHALQADISTSAVWAEEQANSMHSVHSRLLSTHSMAHTIQRASMQCE